MIHMQLWTSNWFINDETLYGEFARVCCCPIEDIMFLYCLKNSKLKNVPI